MSTLLLRLTGPLQAWGCDSRFETRRTMREPTKSGIVGMLAAALGRRRDEPIDDLNALKFGVRVDKEGELLHDFHTARSENGKNNYVTHRYYLSDAAFLVGLECDDEEFLSSLFEALKHPAYPLFLGRRSCVPASPVALGIRNADLDESLRKEPWILSEWMQRKEIKRGHVILRVITDAHPQDRTAVVRKDLAVTFHPCDRRYAYRPVKEQIPVKIQGALDNVTKHDAMNELDDAAKHDVMGKLDDVTRHDAMSELDDGGI